MRPILNLPSPGFPGHSLQKKISLCRLCSGSEGFNTQQESFPPIEMVAYNINNFPGSLKLEPESTTLIPMQRVLPPYRSHFILRSSLPFEQAPHMTISAWGLVVLPFFRQFEFNAKMDIHSNVSSRILQVVFGVSFYLSVSSCALIFQSLSVCHGLALTRIAMFEESSHNCFASWFCLWSSTSSSNACN